MHKPSKNKIKHQGGAEGGAQREFAPRPLGPKKRRTPVSLTAALVKTEEKGRHWKEAQPEGTAKDSTSCWVSSWKHQPCDSNETPLIQFLDPEALNGPRSCQRDVCRCQTSGNLRTIDWIEWGWLLIVSILCQACERLKLHRGRPVHGPTSIKQRFTMHPGTRRKEEAGRLRPVQAEA